MMKKYRGTLIAGTLVMLLPILVGLFLWDRLPDQVATHFGTSGEVDGYSSKAFAVFGIPGIVLGMHWLCVLTGRLDPKAENLAGRMMSLVLWICPVISVVLIVLVYGNALGYEVRVELVVPLLLGLLFVIIGNWLPKCRQTYTLGIKLPWTLNDEANWNRTHRFAGPVWVGCGLVIMLCAALNAVWVMFAALAVMVIAPTVYSYVLSRRKGK